MCDLTLVPKESEIRSWSYCWTKV